jgi:ABC-type uncharacterized transport system permease subunit
VSQYVKSSPHFFRPVTRVMLLGIAVLLVVAALVPAPLETPADPAHAPNPAKSAWFLLWIQELVSYSTLAIYVALALAALLVLVLTVVGLALRGPDWRLVLPF